jgi:Tol biopolymer transport system component
MFEKGSMEPGSGEAPVPRLPDFANPTDWSSDGRWISFVNGRTHGTIWIAPTTGERKPFRFLETPFMERGGEFSPDGKWIAYISNESGRFEAYVRSFSGRPAESGQKIRISERGASWPVWNRNGKELFFVGPDAKLYAAETTGLGHADITPSPHALFEVCPGNTPTGEATQGRQFDVAPDGQKFLFACGNDAEGHYSVFANWKPK